MSILNKIIIAGIFLSTSTTVLASTAVEELLADYQSKGASQFSGNSGKALWNRKFTSSQSSEQRSCSSCHTDVLTNYGKHATTGKEIKPLAPSVMKKRLTNTKKIRKWFKRNCNWTLGRECTAQEKGDILTYLNDQ